jgi:hypothetical protein
MDDVHESAYDHPTRAHRGTMILVFGILGLIVCFPFGIAAWVMANTDLRQMRAGMMDPSGEGLTSAGRILGIVATCLAIAGILIWAIVFMGVLAAGVSSTAH